MANTEDRQFLDPSVLVEEETVRGYKAEHYYPVKKADLFQDRYRVIGKLGYGSASTVWLCHDLRKENKYVALKVYSNCSKVHRELPIYKHINGLKSEHEGRDHIRRLLDTFEISGSDGSHVSVGFLPVLLCLPVAMTDVQPRNILLGVLDNAAFARFERDERELPIPQFEHASRAVYISRPMPLTKGAPSLADLSEARFEGPANADLVMPDLYRAPEVVLGMPWSYPVDVWGFAMTLWDLFEPKRLFRPHGEDGRYSERLHMAQMISIMGPPPLDFLRRSKRSLLFWDEEGKWKGDVPVPQTSLETAEARLQGEEKELFLNFMKKMLQWRPEDRKDIRDVFMDDWFLADLIESGEVVRG
ncbi:hypothetical protein LTR12_016093 [Friedmanniomyces endolithicus]|nr:hypothetical protein LTR12_016093 [Friedmanniomyces endolithicus]